MTNCAYNLNIDVTDLRKELLEYQKTLSYTKEDWGSIFVEKEKLGKYTENFYTILPNCFLSKVRFML